VPHTPPDVRVATAGDVAALTRLINAAYRVEEFFLYGERTNEQEVAALMNGTDSAFLVIDGDGVLAVPVGTVFVRRSGDRGYFGLLSVDPGRQRSGVGKRLVAAAENRLRRLGCIHADLDVVDLRTELLPFYHALGYAVTGATAPFPKPERLRRPAHLVLMTKSLV
jgi:GNAT superfamily N-acetyltransferase